MNNHALKNALSHDALPLTLAGLLGQEVLCGVGKDSQVLLVATVEGAIADKVEGFQTTTKLRPLQSARNLAKDAIFGHRLWTDHEKQALLAKIDASSNLLELLDYWVKARQKYRAREANEARSRS